VVDPKVLIHDSEYLETHLVVLPNAGKKEFLRSYETIAPMVVPRSATEITHDDEFVLFAVTTFKKHSPEFVHKCREMKWTPRDYKYVEGGKEEEKKEVERVSRDERKIWGEALRLSRTGWSEAVMIWIHVLTLRVFVETVLRYGLPLEFISALVKVNQNLLGLWKLNFSPLHLYYTDPVYRRPRNLQRKQRHPWTQPIHT
jgi:V-type H+-transporting ATPase subunit C